MKVHVLTNHMPAGRMQNRAIYEDLDDASRIAGMSTTMKVETFEVIPSSKTAGSADGAVEPSSTAPAS